MRQLAKESDQRADLSQLPVKAARRGNQAAWAVLFRRFRLPLFVYVCQFIQSREEAFDVVQETFDNATRYLGNLREEAKFTSWLFRIAHQKCLRYWERHGKKAALDEPLEAAPVEELADAADNPRDWLIRKEREEALMVLIAQLPLPQRSVLLLHFMEEFSLEEIAEITGAPLGTVKSRMHHAKKALRALLDKKDL
jgi:RNA polymerase sigma-70 factor (ECF subfamily)